MVVTEKTPLQNPQGPDVNYSLLVVRYKFQLSWLVEDKLLHLDF